MTPVELKNLIKARNESKNYRAILIESSPGVGKTQIAAQAANELGIGFMSIHAPLMQPEDYGLPMPNAEKNGIDFLVPTGNFPLENSDCPERGIFLIDEVSQTTDPIQKIIANISQERKIHGVRLKAGWTIVLTGNRQKDKTGANRILPHLADRTTRIDDFSVSLDEWTQWALANGVRTEVIAFLRFRPDLLNNYDANAPKNATPRSWVEGVSAGLNDTPAGLEYSVFKGDVGEGPATEFLAFLKIFRELPNIDSILLDPKKAKLPKDPATIYAVCGALANKVSPQNFDKALEYIRRIELDGRPAPEFSILFIKDARQRCAEVVNTRAYLDWASKEGMDLLT